MSINTTVSSLILGHEENDILIAGGASHNDLEKMIMVFLLKVEEWTGDVIHGQDREK